MQPTFNLILSKFPSSMYVLLCLMVTLPALTGFFSRSPAQGKLATGKVIVNFENVKSTGTLRLALYNSPESFMVEKEAELFNFKVKTTGKLNAEIPDLPHGVYAFAVFLDENENMILDKNLFGIPTEPYAFSGKAASKWRLPKFDEVKFELKQASHQLAVHLEKWRL
jgi:uncharacterized protein (DUF2141 family)